MIECDFEILKLYYISCMYIVIYSYFSIGILDDVLLKINIYVNLCMFYVFFLYNEIKIFVYDVWL